jgi:Arc/MetJ-type ribon-helix-helix transcriptional regulator
MIPLCLTIVLAQPAPPLPAGPAIVVKPEKPVAARGQRRIELKFETKGQEVRCHPLTAGLDVLSGDKLSDPKSAMIYACTPGTYELLVYTALDNKPTPAQVVSVVFEGEPVPPPKPKPDPDVPPPPGPDSLTKKLQLALDAAAVQLQPDKRRMFVGYLAESYATAAELVADDSIVTAGQMLDAIRDSVRKMIQREGLAANQYEALRRAIADEIAGTLSVEPDTVLDKSTRTQAAGVFKRLGEALSKLK